MLPNETVVGQALSYQEAKTVSEEEFNIRKRETTHTRAQEIADKSLSMNGQTLRWKETVFGGKGKHGWPLWVSLHGGGEVPAPVNDEQWDKQAKLYQPENGIYLAPRAPGDTWFMWNEPHVDPLLCRLIESMVALREVDPDQIYLLGYSAGGNGVYHLAARMADRFAAASAMAGYPTQAPLENLRHLPFGIFVGKHDITFNRADEAEKWRKELDFQQKKHPGDYLHRVKIYPDYGHWMHGEDAETLPWMARFRRNPWPATLTWTQDVVPHRRFYWLEVSGNDAVARRRISARVTKQTIALAGDEPDAIRLWLSDKLVDLDQPVRVTFNGKTVHQAKVARTRKAIRDSLASRLDLSACATAVLDLDFHTP
ncbi:MAG: dienelactone hydrolase family protein, partial [Luteolibacter sp.]